MFTFTFITHLIEYIPLQQGLRQVSMLVIILVLYLIEYIPLQQGLRHTRCYQLRRNGPSH